MNKATYSAIQRNKKLSHNNGDLKKHLRITIQVQWGSFGSHEEKYRTLEDNLKRRYQREKKHDTKSFDAYVQ